jgi:pyruvate dehydrogenase E2 component (dihydrolipoamide acetyltransferase)
MRSAIARRMSESNRDVPQFSVSTSVDMGSVVEAIAANNAEATNPRITATSFLVAAAARVLHEHPGFNACWDGEELYLHDDINVGVAIAVDGGLLAPALLGAGELALPELAVALADLVQRARASKLRSAELMEATFTVSNLGMFDVSAFTAIVTPPQVAILATSAVASVPTLENDRWRSTPTMTATLSCDHRAVDGVDAARFLQTFKQALHELAAVGADVVGAR